jgi:baculoviral IAP repeat-containing protein 6
MILHCVACILYKSEETPEVNEQFVESLITYALSVNDYYIKQSIDWIFCSLFYKKPKLIVGLTSLINLNFANKSSKISLAESKSAEKRALSLIETLAHAIQSPQVLHTFMKLEFFGKFVDFFMQRIENFSQQQQQQHCHIELNLIRVFVSLAEFESGKDWLGSQAGCNLWQKLLALLCNTHKSLAISNYEQVSLLVIQFVKRMIFCHAENQTKFAAYIKKLIKDTASLSKFTLDKSAATISGFLHQLIIQVLLDDQTILVNFERKSSLFKAACNSSLGLLTHPRFGTGNNCRLVELPVTKTCSQITQFISDVPLSQILAPNHNQPQQQQQQQQHNKNYENMNENVLEMKELLNKFKAFTDYTEPAVLIPPKKNNSTKFESKSQKFNLALPKLKLYLDDVCIASEYTLSKVLSIHLAKTKAKVAHDLTLTVHYNHNFDEEFLLVSREESSCSSSSSSSSSGSVDEEILDFSTPLDAFVKCDGLIVLAECLPTLMPFIHEPLLNITDKDKASHYSEYSQAPKTSPDFVDYVIMNESDEPFVDDLYNDIPSSSAAASSAAAANSASSSLGSRFKKISMPPHAFIAFGLFLKIPGYAQVMLRQRKQAQCILKLLLGGSSRSSSSTNNKDEDSFGLSLSTVPFLSLKHLLNDLKSSSDQAIIERKRIVTDFMFENRMLNLVLSILSSLSHHPHRQRTPHFEQQLIADNSPTLNLPDNATPASNNNNAMSTNDEKSNLYWAKGTGFGTGSTIQQWDAEKTLMQQKMEEEHVTCILEILASFIECCLEDLSDMAFEVFDHSCIINALSSYLRNDSVLDMSRHIPLYKSALRLLRSLILCPKLRSLVEVSNIYELISNMKQFVDSYTQRIKLTEEEGLSCLVPALNEAYSTLTFYIKPNVDKEATILLNKANQNVETTYCQVVKSLQFDTYSIITENDNGQFKANISYYYEATLNELSNLNNSNRAKRLAQETVTLSNSLPLSYSSSVFVRCDEERLDVMKVLITGPQDTPYANGCFEFDVFFPSDYPDSPPMINMQTTGNQTVRFNPNLYHDGKVCLSILNTWHGRPEERWNGQTSSFLQVLVSIQSLILVSEPYFNEPGYERSRGTPAGTASSIEHDANIRQATIKWAMLEMIRKASPCFKEIVQKHFYYKRKEIREQCEMWSKEMDLHANDKQIGQSISKSSTALKRHMTQLFDELDKIEASIENTNEESSTNSDSAEKN